jgi:acyl-CoA reductase-like NAD-dependent aldehyde dehydrogenase
MQCGIEIENIFKRIGLQEGVFQALIGDSTAAETLIDSNDISAVTFTGSVSAGAKVAQRGWIPRKEMCIRIRRK